MKSVALMLVGVLLGWVLLAIPSRYWLGEWAVAYSGTAALLCLLPALGTLAVASWVRQVSSELFLLVMLGGTGVRMFVVLGGAVYLQFCVPFYQQHPGFWAWLLVFYLLTLTMEMALILSQRPGDHK